ncbi:hypothetical protein [Nocardia sp. NPDC049707]|uniref:hypothetical protein n=1 Tax=unclassified Nocardia TaxID=2637762 RepID=UPI0034183FE1|nr:hypothetical protein OH799_11655 [Nocardia sp. NBC_00881]
MDETDPFDDLEPGEKQRLFELGAAEMRGETAEAGWKMYQEFETPLGIRRYTNVRTLEDGRVQAREYRVDRNDPQTIFDLEMDRYLIENGVIHEVHWITAE